ncbi:glutathione ABC transporter substrate-binding protein [Geomicrobium sp. JCM 19055]|uniref:glutathione ABC transporter substrate-binding protein n=1 Tax=Geomicrobium sp. JCM 19055 TaxID=1460649 RepID=UPI00045EDDB0|nr:glutathione ABC transporter substrate-binding protein [Geomicrobium sp. JCM 19055]GAJ99080.1 oligopeptide ABC transporter, periplasmic oligopeptide-binding protein OppA [Geomicrobium sp. JCM 19055]
MKKFKRSFVPLAIASIALVACSSDPTEGENEGTETDSGSAEDSEEAEEDGEAAGGEGGNFVLAMPADAVTLDPHQITDVPSHIVTLNLYENLIMFDEDMELQPVLAESYEQIDDLTWEFYLREGITFHDGAEFNADAVVTNFDRFLDPETASPRASLFEPIESVEAIDEFTVQITTDEPFAPLIPHLAHGSAGIISPDAIEADENITVNPVGTGPFELENWEQGNEIVLARYEDYWGDSAILDNVTLKVVPEQSTRMAMIEQGEAHFMQQIEPANVGRIDSLDNVEVVTQEGFGIDYIGFNTSVEPFDDPLVRQALSMALDSEAIVNGLYEGYGQVATNPLNDIVNGASADVEGLEYDPEQAAELLAEAGYEDGFSATLITNDANPMRVQIAELAQDQFGELGIDISIEQMEWGAYLDRVDSGDTEMFILGWSISSGDADNGLHPLFHSDNVGANGNQTFFENDELDELLDAAREEMDEDARQELYQQAQQILADEAPMIYTLHTDYVVGVADSVNDFIHYPNGQFPFWQISISEEAGDSSY